MRTNRFSSPEFLLAVGCLLLLGGRFAQVRYANERPPLLLLQAVLDLGPPLGWIAIGVAACLTFGPGIRQIIDSVVLHLGDTSASPPSASGKSGQQPPQAKTLGADELNQRLAVGFFVLGLAISLLLEWNTVWPMKDPRLQVLAMFVAFLPAMFCGAPLSLWNEGKKEEAVNASGTAVVWLLGAATVVWLLAELDKSLASEVNGTMKQWLTPSR